MPLSIGEIERLCVIASEAVAALKSGAAGLVHLQTLVDASNLLEHFVGQGIAAEEVDAPQVVKDAHGALLSIVARHGRTGLLRLGYGEAPALEAMLDVHRAALEQCTRGAWIRALDALRKIGG